METNAQASYNPAFIDRNSGALELSAFRDQYAQTIATKQSEPLAIWYVDIRNFRSINPQYGFELGNEVLRVLVRAMQSELCHDMAVARLGGDNFVALSSCVEQKDVQEAFARFNDTLQQGVAAKGVNQRIIISAGVYYLRASDLDHDGIQPALDYASKAHRKAREVNDSCLSLFSNADLELDRRRIIIEQSIDEALATGQIEVWYQPQVDYVFGEVIGAEALARWNHPKLGWIEPGEFIPVLESCRKIYLLDCYVWEEACRNASRWRNMSDGRPVPISVNLASIDLLEPELINHFLELRQSFDLPAGSLRLEISERAFVHDPIRLETMVDSMRGNLLAVEMDDFGSGHISLNMFENIKVDAVKLDVKFTQASIAESRGGVMLNSIIRMLQGLDMAIIAKGVETIDQAEMLKNMGCHLMQGFLFSQPLPLEEFEEFVASNRTEELAARREHKDSQLDNLLNTNAAASYLFNHAMGPMLFFFADNGMSESIMVNDQFYEACGLGRLDFGNHRINPIEEIEAADRATFWRAAAEAREHGAAMCSGVVRLTGYRIECVIRYLGLSSRGNIYSLSIVRSKPSCQDGDGTLQAIHDLDWDLDLIRQIVPSGFIKCDTTESLAISYIDESIWRGSGLSKEQLIQRFHNSLIETVLPEDRIILTEAVAQSKETGKPVSCAVRAYYGTAFNFHEISFTLRVKEDDFGKPWVYAFARIAGEVLSPDDDPEVENRRRTITFEYDLPQDLLVIHRPTEDGTTRDLTVARYLQGIAANPTGITKASATKVMSLIRDLRHHPSSGFFDIKCSFDKDEELRWYHINFTCDADAEGNATIMHGYAQGANDQMGSARWWRARAESDQLTGLLNRNAAEQAINLSMRTQGHGVMFMIDMDNFKRVNDKLGHLAGDALLRNVAGALASKFREGDVLGRYGGDEFVAFMSVANGDPVSLAERRAKAIVDAISAIDEGDGVHAGCSVGVALSSSRETTFYDLLEIADDALYRSKERGKGMYTLRQLSDE